MNTPRYGTEPLAVSFIITTAVLGSSHKSASELHLEED